ncbi:MAG: helix-turn-helix transcriptional regulator [Oscillospiraceae bacterium]|jgi:transcriptional regulator with XRE-family HTH domain|nr:helix-turn-helix transcriptional regulator [Oscillospiraceae bacterium]MCI9588296.1 helix-turn-helix transcriptional regulator [Oscillospiraceae bacterium]
MENDLNTSMGTLIRAARMERGMKQRELAECLGVTDKAVSKWENGGSCPDIALLIPLAETLGLEVTELLQGRRHQSAPDPEEIALRTLTYSQETSQRRRKNLRLWLFGLLSALLLLSAIVCWIVDAALNHDLTWSLLVCCSLALAWAVLLPLLTAQRRPILWSLAALAAAILPYLYIMGNLLSDPRVFRFGLPIAPAAMLYLLGIYAVVRLYRRRKWRAAGEILEMSAILEVYIDFIVYAYLGTEMIWAGPLTTIALSLFCFLADYILRHRKTET